MSVQASRSILPGDAFTDLLPFLAVIPIIDAVVHDSPHAIAGVIVDDIQIIMVGSDETVKTNLSTAVSSIMRAFEQQGMTVATKPGKMVMLISNWSDRRFFGAHASGR